MDRNNQRLARVYLTDALADYAAWGASAKVRQLAGRHLTLLGDAINRLPHDHPDQATDALDTATVIGATRALSGEIDSDRLLRVLLRLLTQTAGAQRAILFSCDENHLVPGLEARMEADGLSIRSLADKDWSKQVAEKAVNYVHHTCRSLIVDDATKDERLSADPYVVENQARSILCTPILNQAELEGVVYLENDLVNGAFTPARLGMVETLATQAAISLKNARLFQNMQREATQREKAERRLREVAQGTAAVVGESFFRELVLHLSRALEVRIAFVTECLDPEQRVARALAFIDNGQFIDDVEYELEGTPCKRVIDGDVCFYPNQLEQHFPKEKGLASYLGVPMYGVDDSVMGHLAVVGDRPMRESADDESLLQVFAVRAGAELERQHAQAEAERSQRILAERERLASLGEFASMIAHEVRSPLSTIAMALEFLQDDNPSDKAVKRIQLATAEQERLQSLLSEILLFAKPQLLKHEPIDLNALIHETIATLEQGLESDRRVIDYCSPAQPTIVNGDRAKLMQVLINLLSNACQAVSEHDRVDIELRKGPGKGQTSIEVRNAGDIPADVLAKLTEPFFTTKSRGTGLGLAIVKRIIEAHEGQLQIRCDAGQAVCASVILPAG